MQWRKINKIKILGILIEELARSIIILTVFIMALYLWQRPSKKWSEILVTFIEPFQENKNARIILSRLSLSDFRKEMTILVKSDSSIIDKMDDSSLACFRDVIVSGFVYIWLDDTIFDPVFSTLRSNHKQLPKRNYPQIGCIAIIETLSRYYMRNDTNRIRLFSLLIRLGYNGDSVDFFNVIKDSNNVENIEDHMATPPDRKFIEYLLSDKRIKKKLKADSIQAIIYRERLKRQREEAFKKLKNDLVDTLKSVDLYETVLITFLSLGLAVILLFMLSWMGFYKGYVSGNEKLRSIWRNLMLLFSLPTVITAIFLQVTGLSVVIGDFSSIMVILPVVALLVIGSGIFAELWKQTESVGLEELKKPYFRIMMARDESSNITRKMLRRALLVHNINIVIRRGIYLFDALMLFMILIYVENEYLLTRFIPMENTADLQIRLARFSVGYVLLLFLFRASARILQVLIMRRSE